MENKKSRPSIFKFHIEYIDLDGNEQSIDIRPKDLGYDIKRLNNIKLPVLDKNGKVVVFEYPYPIKDINYWFFFVSSQFRDSNKLSRKLVQGVSNIHRNKLANDARNKLMRRTNDAEKAEIAAQKSAKDYDERVKNKYKIKQLKECTLRLSSNYLKGYHEGDYSIQTGDENDIAIPILYADTYSQYKTSLPSDDINKSAFQLFKHPGELITSREALITAIKKYLSVDESNLNAKDLEFRRTMKRYISKYLDDNLNISKNNLIYSPDYYDNKDLINRIQSKLIKKRNLINNNKDLSEFILDVLNDAEDNLLLGCYKDGSVNFYVFLANFITQLKVHELSKAVDKFGTKANTLTDGTRKYTNEYFRKLHQKSLEEVYHKEESEYFDMLRQESYEKVQEEDIIDELLDYYKVCYPDLSEEDIINTFIKPDQDNDQTRRKGIK